MMRFFIFLSSPFSVLVVLLLLTHIAVGQRMRDLIDLTPPQPAPAQPAAPTQPAQPTSSKPRLQLPGATLGTRTQSNGSQNSESAPSVTPVNPSGLPWGRTTTKPFLNTPPIVINSDLNKIVAPSNPVPHPSQESPILEATKITQQLLTNAASFFEDVTEDEQEKRELQIQRRRAEEMLDPDLRKEAIARVERSEAALQSMLARRQNDEKGADLFDIPHLKEQYLKEGWCQLFDGFTQTGWNIQNQGPYAGGQFAFDKNNEIVSDPYHPGLIYTTMPFGDMMLRFDYCAEQDSEVFLLLKTPSDPADLNRSCYTFVLNSIKSNRPRSILLGRHGLSFAELRSMREMNDLTEKAKEDEVWHSVIINCEGSDLSFRLDNQSAMTYFESKPLLSGHVAFLVAKGKVRFKNILWKPLPSVPIVDPVNNGANPWRIVEDAEFEEVKDNNDRVKFQLPRGTVESKDVYENFVLQMQYCQGMVSGKSSLFVRSIPGRNDTGYEISLQNFPKLQDRESMVGVDAGSFQRIKDARYVRAQDLQWTYLTVMAMGRQFQTWVNGVPVCEIEDRRSIKATSSSGPFLQPGALRWSVPPENALFEFQQPMISLIQVKP